ncbi:TGc domain-containing protein [Aphelenchoides besseyi]|nr:TGc domain-containing protein [Aphelenchoides besseyi]
MSKPWENKQSPEWLDFRAISLQPNINSQMHFTENYLWQNDRKLVVRRGFPIQIRLHGMNLFDPEYNKIIFQLHLDTDSPRNNKDAHKRIEVHSRQRLNSQTSELFIPSTATIGCWKLRVFSALITQNETIEMEECTITKMQRIKLYVIFNAFNAEDEVHMEQRSTRDYYLNAEVDVYFSATAIGNSKFNFHREPWIHSQFDESTMKTAIFILEKLSLWYQQNFRGGLSFVDRQNVVRTARKLCFAISYILLDGHDNIDQRVNGRSADQWRGTAELINEFVNSKTRSPVHFVDCSTYANVFVSLLRAFGVCSRVVSCVECTHDAEIPLVVDRAYVREIDGDAFMPMKQSDNSEWESTCNYHLWIEIFCRRNDLPNGYDGWQALDPTPQFSIENAPQCGPVSVSALREGRLDLSYDGWFFYGLLNSDLVRWFYEYDHETNEYHLLKVDFRGQKERTGRALLTSNPRAFGFPLDITADYRDVAKVNNEFRAHIEAIKSAGILERRERVHLLYGCGIDNQVKDIYFWVHEIGMILFGDDINIELELVNRATDCRTIRLSVRIHTQQQNGKLGSQINHFRERLEMNPHEKETLKISTPIGDYVKHSTVHRDLVAVISANVQETDQIFYREEKFQIVGSAIAIIAPTTIEMEQPAVGLIVFRNPLGETLTNVKFTLQSGRLETPVVVERCPTEIAAGQRLKLQIRFSSKFEGQRLLMVTMSSQQINRTSALHFVRCLRQEVE